MEINLTSASIFAENLRKELLSVKPPLIKGRRQFFRTYPNSFVGSEVVEWWIKQSRNKPNTDINKSENNNNDEEISNADEKQSINLELTPDDVTQVMQTLADFGILHSIHGDAPFKNDSSLYRFTADDGSCCSVVEALVKGKRLHESTTCPNCAILQRVCEYGEFISDKCMRGSDLIPWVIEHGLASHRDDAMRLCRLMHDHGILKPASKHIREFTDGRPFYIFGVDFTTPPMTIETFISFLNTASIPDEIAGTSENPTGTSQHVRQLSGQLLDMSVSDQRSVGRRKNTSSSSIGSDDSGYNEHAASTSQAPYTSLLTEEGKLTPEALAHPDAPFTKKYLRIYPDAVGYGFIIRGSSPCYVKIVDPESPAGKSGLKAWQYITEINNRDVTRKNHTEIEDLILNGPKCLLMTVMVPKEENGYAHLQRLNTQDFRKLSQPVEMQTSKSSAKDAGATNGVRRQSVPVSRRNNLPSAQPWIKQQRKASDFDVLVNNTNLRFIH